LLEFEPHEQELHYEVPIHKMLSYTESRTLLAYKLLHGSSHLVAYRPSRAGFVTRARNALTIRQEQRRGGRRSAQGTGHEHGVGVAFVGDRERVPPETTL
jgi:hypothetical protein